jgi:hypothetical protein
MRCRHLKTQSVGNVSRRRCAPSDAGTHLVVELLLRLRVRSEKDLETAVQQKALRSDASRGTDVSAQPRTRLTHTGSLSQSRSSTAIAEQGRRRTSSVLLVRTRPPTSSAASRSTNDTPACIRRPAVALGGASSSYTREERACGVSMTRMATIYRQVFRTWCRRLAQHSPATPPPTITTSVASVLACARTLMRPVRSDVRAGRARAPRSVTLRASATPILSGVSGRSEPKRFFVFKHERPPQSERCHKGPPAVSRVRGIAASESRVRRRSDASGRSVASLSTCGEACGLRCCSWRYARYATRKA